MLSALLQSPNFNNNLSACQYIFIENILFCAFVSLLCQNWLWIWSEMEEEGGEKVGQKQYSSQSFWFISAAVQRLTLSPGKGSVGGKNTSSQNCKWLQQTKQKRAFVSLSLHSRELCESRPEEGEDHFFCDMFMRNKTKNCVRLRIFREVKNQDNSLGLWFSLSRTLTCSLPYILGKQSHKGGTSNKWLKDWCHRIIRAQFRRRRKFIIHSLAAAAGNWVYRHFLGSSGWVSGQSNARISNSLV